MDILTYGALLKQIHKMGISDAKIQEVIETFLLAHPEYIGATELQAAQIIANTAAIEELKDSEIEIVTIDEFESLSEDEKKAKTYFIYDPQDNVLTIDTTLDKESTNPIQNSAVAMAIGDINSHILLNKDNNVVNMYTISEGTQIPNNNPFLSLAAKSYYDLKVYGDKIAINKEASMSTLDGGGLTFSSRTGSAEYKNNKMSINASGKSIVAENGAINTTGNITSETDVVISNSAQQISLAALSKKVDTVENSIAAKLDATDLSYGVVRLDFVDATLLQGSKTLDKDIIGATVSLVARSSTKYLNVINLSMNCTNKTLNISATGSGFSAGDVVYVSYIAID